MPWRRGTLITSSCGCNCCSIWKPSDSTRTGIRSMSADLSPPTASPATVVAVPPPGLLPPLPTAAPLSSLFPATPDLPLASPPPRARLRRAARWTPLFGLGAGAVVVYLMVARTGQGPADFLTAKAVRGDLAVTVTERGELDSINSVTVRCDVEGEKMKLVSIVPEGTHVKKDEEVGRFDTDELIKLYSQQEVKWKTAEGKWKSAIGDLAVQKNK